ncbi:MAG: SRPBCC family protein [Flavobacteriaceae bacterium]|nr:SRPBCC family protein [Flavobacteriaceae bacterium]
MKFLKRFFLFLIVVVVVGLIYVAFQPSEYDVSRSKVIKAPISSVFNTVNEMKTWKKWGPWHEDDSTIVVTYGDVTSGVDAFNSWTSKDGPGNMKTVNIVPNQLIEQKMQFNDFDPSDVIWKFKEVEEGTQVTWHIKEDAAPFMFKMFSAMSGGWDNMLGPMQEKGLNNLENVVLEEIKIANAYRLSDVKPVELSAKKFIGYFHKTSTEATHEEMSKLFMTSMPKAGMYAAQSGLQEGDYVPAAVFTKWDEKTKEAEFYIGLLLNKDVKPAKGMKVVNIPKGKGVTVTKFGTYGNGDPEAHIAIDTYLKANSLTPNGLVWELYVNDPMTVKPQDIQTQIYYLLK